MNEASTLERGIDIVSCHSRMKHDRPLPDVIGRLPTWPLWGRLFAPSPFERFDGGNMAAVIDLGEWFEP